MARIELPTDGSPHVTIESVNGSLQVKGWSEERIRIDVRSEDDLHYTNTDDMLTLHADSDCVLRVPEESALTVQSVNRDAYIANVEGEVHVESISGSLTIKAVGETRIENVSGNLTVRTVEGDLAVSEIAGNAAIRGVEGDLKAEDVHANLSLREIEGEIVAHTDGNADLRLDMDDAGDVEVEAAGNLFCNLAAGNDADVEFESGAQSIHINTDEVRKHVQASQHEFTLGDGGSDVRLKAGGHIDFRSRENDSIDVDLNLDLDMIDETTGLADEITEQVSAQLEAQLESVNEQLESLQERLRHTTDRATRKAHERVAAAQRKLQLRMQNRSSGRSFGVNLPMKKADPVSEQERMLILQMVQDKKISVTQAEMLLNTIEGRPLVPAPAAEAGDKPEAGTEGKDA
jgi:hypothetical protein